MSDLSESDKESLKKLQDAMKAKNDIPKDQQVPVSHPDKFSFPLGIDDQGKSFKVTPAQFEKGFPLEKPEMLLPWSKPVEEIARLSGGVLRQARYWWSSLTYLGGLTYPLTSDQNVPFEEMSAWVGLSKEGLWSDAGSLEGFDRLLTHLTKLFGPPTQSEPANDQGEKSVSWKVGSVKIYLSVIEQHAYKCYLTISHKE